MDINLSPEQIEEISRCVSSPEYFVETFCWLQQKASAGVSTKDSVIPFTMGREPGEPHFFQRKILRWLHNKENVLTLKSRRVGCSWIAAAYAAWLINFYENVNVLFISRTGRDAKKILAKVKFILKNLAYHDNASLKKATRCDWLRGTLVTDSTEKISVGYKNDAGEIVIESTVESINNTDDSARGDDATFIVFDELSFYLHPDDTWSSATKTLTHGGHWMAISTPNAIGDVFHRMCASGDLAESGQVTDQLDYKYIKIHWREAGITEEQVKKASVGDTQAKQRQEWEWEFYTPNTVAFDPIHLAVCYKPPEQYPEIAAALAEYRQLVFDRQRNKGMYYYYSGADTAKGNQSKRSSTRDFHNFTAVTKHGIQAVGYHSQDELSFWAGRIVSDGRAGHKMIPGKCSELHKESPGFLQIENEGPGYTTSNNHITPQDGLSTMVPVSMKHKFKHGIIDRLIIKVESHSIVITDLFTYQCMQVFMKGSLPGSYEAASGYNDDPVIGLALAEDARDQEGGMEFPFGNSIDVVERGQLPDNQYLRDIERLTVAPMFNLNLPGNSRRMVDSYYLPDLPAPEPFNLLPEEFILPEQDYDF